MRDRWRDVAVRRALGAGFLDLVRLQALEHGVVAAAGAVLGILVARPVLSLTRSLIGGGFLVIIKPPVIDAG
jgi:ABC-type antimicrobial peptide transport system permease subunit